MNFVAISNDFNLVLEEHIDYLFSSLINKYYI